MDTNLAGFWHAAGGGCGPQIDCLDHWKSVKSVFISGKVLIWAPKGKGSNHF
jgi:hypothetical protein